MLCYCRTGFVRADRLLALRQLLDQLSSTAGLINEEKGDLKTLKLRIKNYQVEQCIKFTNQHDFVHP